MTKKIVSLIFLLALALAAGAQTVQRFEVPDVPLANSRGVKFPSIAANSRGDIMVVFRNKTLGIMYYFKKKSDGSTAQESLPGAEGNDVLWTSTAATADGNFHAAWGIDEGPTGIYYSEFDIETENWSSPQRVFNNPGEDIHLRVSPVNNDIALCTALPGASSHQNIHVIFRKGGQTAWTNQINVSNQTGTTTGAYSQFDEQGDLHVVYSQDRGDGTNDLITRVALVKRGTDGNYSLADNEGATTSLSGTHLLPSLAVTGGKGMITFMWRNKAGYYYVPYERSGDALAVDQSAPVKIASAPVTLNNMYCSRAIAYVDEIMFTYFDTGYKLKLKRWKSGQWLDSEPVALSAGKINKWPYNVYVESNIGLLAIWFIEEDNKGITYYSIYNYPKASVRSPIHVTFEKGYERNLFHGFYLYDVDWENNPYNTDNQVTVVRFNVYRRTAGGSDNWLKVGTVDGTVLTFADVNGISADSDYRYAVTAVNDKNVESSIVADADGEVMNAEKIVGE